MMAEFVQTMNDWRRMCDWLSDEYGDYSCLHCPVYECSEEYNGCDAIFSKWAEGMDWAKFEEVIAKWVADHPKPVYPTWGEWLCEQGMVVISPSPRYEEDFERLHYLTPVVRDPISDDIAEKLGLEPKER